MSHQFLRQGLSLKCRNALGLDFTALTYLCFSVALSYMYIVQLEYTCSLALDSSWVGRPRKARAIFYICF